MFVFAPRREHLWKPFTLVARAYTTMLSDSDEWSGPRLEIASVPSGSIGYYSVEDLVGSVGLEPTSIDRFEALGEAVDLLVRHFAEAGIGELVALAFEEDLAIVEDSPGKAKVLSAVAVTGAIAAGSAVSGQWAIIAVPTDVFLWAAAPETGHGFGVWVGAWFRTRRNYS